MNSGTVHATLGPLKRKLLLRVKVEVAIVGDGIVAVQRSIVDHRDEITESEATSFLEGVHALMDQIDNSMDYRNRKVVK